MVKKQDKKAAESSQTRRKFLTGASVAAGAAVAGFPMISKAQAGPITMRW